MSDRGQLIDDGPKSAAGRPTVALPKEIAPELGRHLLSFADSGEDGLVFVGPQGGGLRRSNFRRTWTKARNAIGMSDLHLLSRSGARFRCCHRPVSNKYPQSSLRSLQPL